METLGVLLVVIIVSAGVGLMASVFGAIQLCRTILESRAQRFSQLKEEPYGDIETVYEHPDTDVPCAEPADVCETPDTLSFSNPIGS